MKICGKSSGFSLIELIIILIILSIISAVIYIRWSDSTSSLDAQIALLANDLRYTQNLAMAKNERCRLVITSDSSYEIRDSNETPQTVPSSNNGKLISNIKFVLPPTPPIFTSKIIFDGKGVPYTDLTNPESPLTTDAAIITLKNAAGRTRAVSITPNTGKIATY